MKSYIRDWADQNNAVPTVPHWPDFITSQGDPRKSFNLHDLGFGVNQAAMIVMFKCHKNVGLMADQRATQPFLALAVRVDNARDFQQKYNQLQDVVAQDALTFCPCAGKDQLEISAHYIPPAPPAPKSFSFADMMPARAALELRGV